MNLKKRRELLHRIYQLHDNCLKDYKTACQEKCSACCTINVTLTSLEAYEIVEYLRENDRRDLIEKLKAAQDKKRFHPKITTNRMADLCMKGEPIPDEEAHQHWGDCPLLEDKLCPIYEVRPFECRSFSSKHNCEEEGMADMESSLMSINTVFKQYIEHLDQFGHTGNLIDMILDLHAEKDNQTGSASPDEKGFKRIENSVASILLIPPEHQGRLQPIVAELMKLKIGD